MPEPLTTLIAIVGLIGVAFAFSTMNLVKDLGRTIALALLVILVVLMSDRILPLLNLSNFSFDRLPDFRNFRLPNPFANERTVPNPSASPDGISNSPPVQRIPSAPPPASPAPTPSPIESPVIEPFEAGGIAPVPVPVLPPSSNPQPSPSPVPNSGSNQRPITAWW